MVINGLDRDTGEGIMLPTETCLGCGKLIFIHEDECPLCQWRRPEAERHVEQKRLPIIDKDGVHFN